jgi:hypothetical protein
MQFGKFSGFGLNSFMKTRKFDPQTRPLPLIVGDGTNMKLPEAAPKAAPNSFEHFSVKLFVTFLKLLKPLHAA